MKAKIYFLICFSALLISLSVGQSDPMCVDESEEEDNENDGENICNGMFEKIMKFCH